MGKFQIVLLLSVVACAIISTVQSVPVRDTSVESENAAKCKKLCGFCGCTGYYCGDECLCECNSVTDGEAACADTMKSKCKKLELPFEVLVQGPNVNRLVRSLLYANPDEEMCVKAAGADEKTRSTISIYKPHEVQQNDEVLLAPKLVDEEDLHKDDSPIHIIVPQKVETEFHPVKTEMVYQNKRTEKIEESQSDTEPMDQKSEIDNMKLPSTSDRNEAESMDQGNESGQSTYHSATDDAVDRVNIKRHIIDVNQDVSDLLPANSNDNYLHKRDLDVLDDAKAVVKPAAAAKEVAFIPKLRKVFENIPTSDDIQQAWEVVRSDMNAKINASIALAQQKAADLRAKFAPVAPPSPPPPPPTKPIKSKFKALFASDLNDYTVGAAPKPAVPLLPVAPFATIAAENEYMKNLAAAQLAAKIQRTNALKNYRKWFNPWLLGLPLDESLGSPYGGAEQEIDEDAADTKPEGDVVQDETKDKAEGDGEAPADES